MAADGAERSSPLRFYLPDFCAARSVLLIVVIVELVAIMFAVARQVVHRNFWIDLATASLFLLWLGLCCAALMCRARTWFSGMSARTASAIIVVMLVGVVGVLSEAVYQFGQYWMDGQMLAESIFPDDHALFLLRNLSIGFIVSALTLRYFYIASEWRRSVEQAALARIHALQARIRPHFLFNSMNTIAALTRSDPLKAEAAVEDLADLFRASLNEATLLIPIEQEFDIARTHARVEKLRLGERLEVVWDIEGVPLTAQVPSLIVQPLLENAVYHGIEKLAPGGIVTIRGRLVGEQIAVTVSNPIAGGSGYREREGNKMALENIRQRLELAWPGSTRLEIQQQEDRFEVTLTFPCTLPASSVAPVR